MKVLITGGAGFIGSHLVKLMLEKYPHYKITVLDKLTYCGNLNNLKTVVKNPQYRFVKGNICNQTLVNRLMKTTDAIIHLAAETHVDRSIKNGNVFVETNVLGTHVLLQEALRFKIKRFVHVSTDEVYGSRLRGYFKEDDILNPSSPYSASKAASDLLARSYFTTHGMNVVISRCSNNFGGFQYPEKVIPLFVTNLIEGKKIPLYGTGKNVRDWIYVTDHCRALDILLHKGKAGEIYNIAGENELNNLKLTRSILKLMNKSEQMIQPVADRLGHDWRYAIDGSKIRRLGFKPQFAFEEALKETVLWYQKNPSWWKELKNS